MTEAGEPIWRARAFEAAPHIAAALAFAAGAFTLVAVATPALPTLRGLDALERVVAWTLPIVLAEVALLTNGPTRAAVAAQSGDS